MRRRLPPDEARDAVAAVLESLAAQFAAARSTGKGPDWLEVARPDPEQIVEFDRFLWRLARVRQLDELRRLYVRRRSVELEQNEPSNDGTVERLEARDYLRQLAALIEALPESDRTLLLAASDLRSGTDTGFTNAERVRVHRLRMKLAKQLWLERSARRDDPDR
jgi:hypothetical protein